MICDNKNMNKMRKRIIGRHLLIYLNILLTSWLPFSSIMANDNKIALPGDWVEKYHYETELHSNDDDRGYIYLLVENQENIPKQTKFSRLFRLISFLLIWNFWMRVRNLKECFQHFYDGVFIKSARPLSNLGEKIINSFFENPVSSSQKMVSA